MKPLKSSALRIPHDKKIVPYAAVFGIVCAYLEIVVSYRRYVRILKWLTVSLFSYVAVVMAVKVPWADAIRGALIAVPLMAIMVMMVGNPRVKTPQPHTGCC
jgi:hypothetical protein